VLTVVRSTGRKCDVTAAARSPWWGRNGRRNVSERQKKTEIVHQHASPDVTIGGLHAAMVELRVCEKQRHDNETFERKIILLFSSRTAAVGFMFFVDTKILHAIYRHLESLPSRHDIGWPLTSTPQPEITAQTVSMSGKTRTMAAREHGTRLSVRLRQSIVERPTEQSSWLRVLFDDP